MITIEAQDVKAGDIIRPYINERTQKRTSKEFTVTGPPEIVTHPAFSHYVQIPVKNKKGFDEKVFIFSEESVDVMNR